MKWLTSVATWSRVTVPQELTRSRRKRRRSAVEHVAIDLGGRESQVCVRGSDGRMVEEKRVRTSKLKQYLMGRPASVVSMETCAEAFGVAEAAKAAGHVVKVVPASLVRSLGVGSH